MVENEKEISLKEFKAWLVGLIRGKNGKLPDLEDWKLIKEMLDKVVSEKELITIKEKEDPFSPWKSEPYRYYPPYYVGDPPPGQSPFLWWNDSTDVYYTASNVSETPKELDAETLLKLIENWEK